MKVDLVPTKLVGTVTGQSGIRYSVAVTYTKRGWTATAWKSSGPNSERRFFRVTRKSQVRAIADVEEAIEVEECEAVDKAEHLFLTQILGVAR